MLKHILLLIAILLPLNSLAQQPAATQNKAETAPSGQNIAKSPDNATYTVGPFTFPVGAEGVTSRDIYRACKNYFESTFNTRENIARKAICNGYFFGIGGTLLALQQSKVQTGVCLPQGISTEQIITDFNQWAKENINNLDYMAAQGTLTALAKKYPCF